eukprot:CAMPEP_0184480628 /NCGR_PEP_ID=MMETSP0113_2-20130426/2119_1 /TAXON_ID=91329 /ORGANISM="Norrisiella sphaerica, Strain BC52" /LENGTH=497 /DNA_ID=CAMNT_0026859219 /DNA_START=208 /DNA_END=1701 /DNA_ORIENTATION=+
MPILSTDENGGENGEGVSSDGKYGSFETNTPKTSTLNSININPKNLRLSRSNTNLVLRPLIDKPTIERVFSRIEPGSLRGSTFTLASSAIGAGLLSLSLVMKTVGLALGVLLIVTGALLAFLSLEMLLDTADVILSFQGMTGDRSISYSTLAARVLGEKASFFVEIVFVVYSFGVIVGYFLVIGRSIEDVCGAVGISLANDTIPIILAALLALPLCLKRDISSLTFASLLCICAMGFVCIILAYRAFEDGNISDLPAPYARFESGFCSSATIVFFAFNCHTNIFAVYSSMQYPLLGRMKKVTLRSILIQFILYTMAGAFGYILFKDKTEGNILDNFPPEDTLASLCKGGVAIALLVGLPLNMHPTRSNLIQLTRKCWRGAAKDDGDEAVMENIEPSLISLVSITIALLILALFLALNVPGVSIVFSFLGATACVTMCYVYPTLMYLEVLEHLYPGFSHGQRLGLKIALHLLLIAMCGIGAVSIWESYAQIVKHRPAS